MSKCCWNACQRHSRTYRTGLLLGNRRCEARSNTCVVNQGHLHTRPSPTVLQPTSATTRSYSVKSEVTSQRAKGRSCLVTGVTSGIGYEVTKSLLIEGATRIVALARDRERANKALKSIKNEAQRHDVETEVVLYDSSTAFSDNSGLEYSPKKPGIWANIDTMVLCHGIAQFSLLTDDYASIQPLLKTNLESYLELSSRFLRAYTQTSMGIKYGRSPEYQVPSLALVTTSSLLAIKGGSGASVYAASKAGMIAANRALSLEAGQIYKRYSPHTKPFRINTVLPGYIDTPMIKSIQGTNKEKYETDIPLSRFGKPEEVADAILFLIGNEYANNCTLNLDGGLSAL